MNGPARNQIRLVNYVFAARLEQETFPKETFLPMNQYAWKKTALFMMVDDGYEWFGNWKLNYVHYHLLRFQIVVGW